MRIIARRTLKAFWEKHPQAEQTLKAWHDEAIHSDWKTTQDIKLRYRAADFLRDNRVVFNISGNKYSLVVKINYLYGTVYIRFIGTHSEYDKIDAETI